ncbi:MAG TPA: discoidin domain-containing protein, partial [Pedobacter sp.]|uniref:discoidin domain-containing protein n=1 Tax=Pedobacter sp. TaxID=1411316 RepID=UPI002C7C4025
RPGWFYSASTDDKVKTLKQLESIYNTSVGRNSNLLLNVPVDRDGLIHPADSTRLMELRKFLDAAYKTDLAKGKKVTATNVRGNAKTFAAQNLTDGSDKSYWATDDKVTTASLTIDLGQATVLNRIVLMENILLGQRVKSFSVEYWDDTAFKELDKQTTIGHKRILTFPNISTTKIRVNILASNACPALSAIQLYKAPDIQ